MDETGHDSNDLVEESEPHDDDIRWEYHPNACHEPEVFHFKAYQLRSPVVTPLVDSEPWLPFKMREDFEFSKIALAIAMTKTQVNAMIDLLHSVIRHYFCSYFSSIFNPTSLHIPYPTFSFLMSIFIYVHPFMPSHSQTDDKNTIRLALPDTKQLVYWATDIPKQSCCGSPSPGSCAGTSSAATERSHHSKFQTSWTRSTSRSASTTQRLLVIDRFLATTAARSA